MVVQKSDDLTGTHFLNVDLDIHSKSDLQPLVAVLGEKVLVLHVGRHKRTYHGHLEVTKLKDADQTIRVFCALIQELPRAERKMWNDAKLREFNIGVQGMAKPTTSLCKRRRLKLPRNSARGSASRSTGK